MTTRYGGFGRPQGLAFDPSGSLFVVEALAGCERAVSSAARTGEPELVLAAPSLVGVAFDSHGHVVVASNDTAYRLARAPHQPARSAS